VRCGAPKKWYRWESSDSGCVQMTFVCSVAVVDDNEALNRNLTALLRHAGHTVHSFASGEDLFADGSLLDSCDCLLLDVQLPGMSGLDVLRRLSEVGDGPAVLVLTGAGDVPMAVEAMHLGAFDFIEKPYRPDALLAGIEKAGRRTVWLRASRTAARQAEARLRKLTPRQRQVLAGIVDGHSSKIIAHDLNLSVRTVEAYRAQILVKLGARTTTDAVRVALTAPDTLQDLAA
jgi:two-component system, LuxR family, response regulator FixJ